jgi:hypothetical protein
MRLRETRADAKRMAFCVCASNGHIGEPKGRGCGGDLDDWWQAKDLLGRIGTRRGAAGLKVDGRGENALPPTPVLSDRA